MDNITIFKIRITKNIYSNDYPILLQKIKQNMITQHPLYSLCSTERVLFVKKKKFVPTKEPSFY